MVIDDLALPLAFFFSLWFPLVPIRASSYCNNKHRCTETLGLGKHTCWWLDVMFARRLDGCTTQLTINQQGPETQESSKD